jgi:hypothetical protein
MSVRLLPLWFILVLGLQGCQILFGRGSGPAPIVNSTRERGATTPGGTTPERAAKGTHPAVADPSKPAVAAAPAKPADSNGAAKSNAQKQVETAKANGSAPKPGRSGGTPNREKSAPADASNQVAGSESATAEKADFAGTHVTNATRYVADWAVASRDNGSFAFFIIDKRNARLYVFDPRGRLQGSAPVLLGLARGDDSFPGVGDKPLAQISVPERTTPAGRFVAERGRNAQGEDIVWVDYADAVSLHRVRPLNPKERRLERLSTPTAADNRISYGCINVPVAFYNNIVESAWKSGGVIIYVLPEVRPLTQVFPRQNSFITRTNLVRRAG